MPGSEIQTNLFEAYQDIAHRRLPPGFLLSGNQIVQTIGDIGQLFLGELPTALTSIEQLPEGEVKTKLRQIANSVSLGIPLSRCEPLGVRLTAVDNDEHQGRISILAVFDAALPTNGQAQGDRSEFLHPNHQYHHVASAHSVGVDDTPRVILWESDSEGRATHICRAEEEFAGRTQMELLGFGWVKLLHPDDVDECWSTFRRAAEHGVPFCFTSRRRRSDGEYRWFKTHGVPQFDSQNVLTGFKGFCLDCTHQLDVQSALAASQRMMFTLLDNSPFMVAYVDRDLKYLYVNNNYAEFWQVEPELIVGQLVPDLTGDFFETLQPYLNRTLMGETVFHDEMVVPDEESGEARWLEITHVPAFDANGSVIGFYCFVNDATDSREHERLLHLLLSHAPAMILRLNTDLDILHANLSFEQRLVEPGMTAVDHSLRDILGHESFVGLQKHLSSALAGTKSACEARLNATDGTSIDVFANFVPDFDADHNVIGICGLLLDISELRNVQSKLLRSEARFELAVSGSSLGIFEIDLERPDWVFADHIEDLLGFGRGELGDSRSQIRDLLHPDDRQKYANSRTLISTGESSRLELRFRNKTGDYRWFEVFSQAINRPDGRIGDRAGTIVDINDLKSAQLESAAQVRRRDEFLAMLSHELRNPMSAIVLALDVLNESTAVPADMCPVVDIMMRRTVQISRLLDDLLDVSRVTHNRIVFKKVTHDINLSMIEVAESFRVSAGQKHQTLHIEVCKQPSMIEGDESRLKQVITNLIENAIKYSPEGGEIWVSTIQTDGNVLITVRDSGIGIAPDMIGSIFDLFFQGESTIHRASGGMGVGLFMVNHIVGAHEGVTIATSAGPGLGSQFDVSLPLSMEAPEQPETRNAISFDRLNIVMVEDNHDTRKLASRLLEQRGFIVTEFADGESASQEIPEICPDIAIIDIGLPGKSGLDLAREFRNDDRLDNTMLIALTGYGQESDKKRVVAAGFDLHLVKPADIEELIGAIAHWSSTRRDSQVIV